MACVIHGCRPFVDCGTGACGIKSTATRRGPDTGCEGEEGALADAADAADARFLCPVEA
jgi:hypothetical protein